MTKLKTLRNISTEQLLESFNFAFSDYLIPLCLTKEQLEDKIKSESIKLEFSVGAFEDDQLIAFVLHGYDLIDNLKTVFNAGTGVIPTKRGNRLTTKLYEYVLPILQKNNIDKVLLEVITNNETAIKIYKNIGFKIIRHLSCFKGSINVTNMNNDFEICELDVHDWQAFRSFWDFKPSWQNSATAVEKLRQSNVSIGIYENKKLIGYTIYNHKMKRIHQLSVDKRYRKRGVGRQLLEYISKNYGKDISVTNIEETSKEALKFMANTGLTIFIKQYEMGLNLK